ncbi:MAG: hypothetical protein ACLPWF_24600 [Bryobacteraceae bacterium]
MARLKPKTGAAIGTLSQDETWFLCHGDIAIVGVEDNPFGPGEAGWEVARIAWFRYREALLATKFPTSPPLFGETEFDDAYAAEREERRRRLEERANVRQR